MSVSVLRLPSWQCPYPWSDEPTNIEARETLIRRPGFVHFSFPRGAGSCFRKPFKILERTTVPPKYRNSYLRRLLVSFGLFLALLALAGAARGENAFDLTGPRVQVRVQRGKETLPVAEVPNLQAGDRLWVHPDLPDSQSVHYLMVVAFLRGATNPPPDSWFTRVE